LMDCVRDFGSWFWSLAHCDKLAIRFKSSRGDSRVACFTGEVAEPETEDHCGSPFHSTKVHVAGHNFARMNRSNESLNSKTSNLIRVYAPDKHETCDVKISTQYFPERHRGNGNKATR